MSLLIALALCVPARAGTTYPEVRTDPRYELFGMVQLLAGADRRFAGFHRHDIPYDHEAEAWFKKFSGHPVVARYAALTEGGWNYLQAYQFLFALSDPPTLALREELPDPLVAKMGGPRGVEEFRLLLLDFYNVSRFSEFYEKTAKERGEFVAAVESQARAMRVREDLEDYTGLPVETRCSLIVSPFAEPVLAVSLPRPEPDGRRRVTTVFGPEEYEGRFQFRLQIRASQLQRDILFYDLVRRAADHRSGLARSEPLYAPVRGNCAADWYECAQRNIAFAVGARLLDRSGEHVPAAEWPVKYARIGLPYIGPLVEALAEYEAQRGRYKTLLDFYPRLVSVFESLAAGGSKPLPFIGDFATAMSRPGPWTLIVPESWKERAKPLRERFKGCAVLDDRAALSADLSGKDLVAVGLPADNAWLARRWADLNLPAHIDTGGIAFNPRSGEAEGLRFKGKLALVTTALSPYDPARPVLIYTANDEDSLARALDGNAPRADFGIFSAGKPVKLGTYEKTRLPWRLK